MLNPGNEARFWVEGRLIRSRNHLPEPVVMSLTDLLVEIAFRQFRPRRAGTDATGSPVSAGSETRHDQRTATRVCRRPAIRCA